MTEPMKFCKDCRHIILKNERGPLCGAFVEDDPVYGARASGCYGTRAQGGRCGPDAKLFEPKRQDAA